MKVFEVEQGSSGWHELRLGKITSSRVAKIFKSDNMSLVDELIAERVCPIIEFDGYVTDEMQWGTDHEDEAATEYAKLTGAELVQVGFCVHDKYDWLGMSPDRLTKDNKGAIEIKCPSTKTHIKYIRQDKIPTEYKSQVEQYFLINEECEWVDFVSYDPRFTPRPLFVKRMLRSDVDVDGIIAEIVKFWKKMEDVYEKIIF